MYGHALGALPLDVYTMIFRALEYESLRDTCRALNRTLRRCAERVLEERRGDVRVNASRVHPIGAPRDVDFYAETLFWRERLEYTCRCESRACKGACCVIRVHSLATLRYGGFLALVSCRYAHGYLDVEPARFALAAYDSRCTLQRVVLLHDAALHSSDDALHTALLCETLARVFHMHVEPHDNNCVTLVAHPSDDALACGIAAHWFRYRRVQHTLQWEHVCVEQPQRVSVVLDTDTHGAPVYAHATLYASSACVTDNDLLLCCRCVIGRQDRLCPVTVLHIGLRACALYTVPYVAHQCALQIDADLFDADALRKWSGLRHQTVLSAAGALVFVVERYRDEGSVLMRFDAHSGAPLQRVPLGPCCGHLLTLVAQQVHKRDFYVERVSDCAVAGCASSTRCDTLNNAQPCYAYTPLETDALDCHALHKSIRGDDGCLLRLISYGYRRMLVYKRAWRAASPTARPRRDVQE